MSNGQILAIAYSTILMKYMYLYRRAPARTHPSLGINRVLSVKLPGTSVHCTFKTQLSVIHVHCTC